MANIKKLLVSYFIYFSITMDHKKFLLKWLNESTRIEDYSLSLDQWYDILRILYADSQLSIEEKRKLLDRELENDRSDDGLRVQKTYEASIPAAENKEKHWKILLDEDGKESEYMLFAIRAGFNSKHQEDLLTLYFQVLWSTSKNFQEENKEICTDILWKYQTIRGRWRGE